MTLQGPGLAPSPAPAAAATSASWLDTANLILTLIVMLQILSYLVCDCIQYCFKREVPQDQLQADVRVQQAPGQDMGRGLWYRWRNVMPVAAESASSDQQGPAAPGG